MIPAQLLDGGHDFVAQKAVGIVERAEQERHRSRRRDERERRRNVAAHPDVLVAVLQEVRERVEHGVAEADQHVAGGRLQHAMAEQRHESGNEQRVAASPWSARCESPRAPRPGPPSWISGTSSGRNLGFDDAGERGRRLAAGAGRDLARIFGESRQGRFGGVRVGFDARIGQNGCGGGGRRAAPDRRDAAA